MFFESRGNISIFTENRKFLAITRKLPRFFDLRFFKCYNDNIEKKYPIILMLIFLVLHVKMNFY